MDFILREPFGYATVATSRSRGIKKFIGLFETKEVSLLRAKETKFWNHPDCDIDIYPIHPTEEQIDAYRFDGYDRILIDHPLYLGKELRSLVERIFKED